MWSMSADGHQIQKLVSCWYPLTLFESNRNSSEDLAPDQMQRVTVTETVQYNMLIVVPNMSFLLDMLNWLCCMTFECLWYLYGPMWHTPLLWWIRFTNVSHWCLNKIVRILQAIFSNAFRRMKMIEFQWQFRWHLFFRAQMTMRRHWFW